MALPEPAPSEAKMNGIFAVLIGALMAGTILVTISPNFRGQYLRGYLFAFVFCLAISIPQFIIPHTIPYSSEIKISVSSIVGALIAFGFHWNRPK